MNIFATNICPIKSAQDLDDRRVNKMIVESAQMLSTAVWRKTGRHQEGLYKPAYTGHPCTKWTARSYENFEWLSLHAISLCILYTKVYGRVHASEKVIGSCWRYNHHFPRTGELEEFANCTEYKGPYWGDMTVVERYQKYMNLKWNERDKIPPTWKYRGPPQWKEEVLR